MGKKVILLILGVLIIDQLIKIWVKSTFHAHQPVPVIEGFFQLYYIENRGMAFGTTLGSGAIGKYALSIFRFIAIIAIGIYVYRTIKDKYSPKGLIIALALIFAGATGNLLDSMFYDFIFDIDPNLDSNLAKDSEGNYILDEFYAPTLRPNGFLLGSVVDMFQFTVTWPSWMPFGLGGQEVFGAIWNVADFAISVGVGLIIVRYKTFFTNRKTEPQSGGIENEPADGKATDPVNHPE